MKIADYDGLPSLRVPVDGGEMFTIDVGEGPTVVLVHGSPVSSLEYRAVIGRLKSRFRVIAPDLLTFGQSTGPEDGAGFDQQARAVRQLLDDLGVERFHIVGHDWGGPIGLGAAAETPDQVDSVALINTSVLPDFHPPLAWRPMLLPVLGEVTLVTVNAMAFALPVLMKAARQDGELRQRYEERLKETDIRRTILRLERRHGFEAVCERIVAAVPEMHGPKLVVWGTPEPYFRNEYKRMQEAFPGLEHVEVKGAGHFVTEDAPDALADHLERFLT